MVAIPPKGYSISLPTSGGFVTWLTKRERVESRAEVDLLGVKSQDVKWCAARREYDPPVQKYVISELDSGQRVITERLTHVRSIALGYWIGAGSRDERGERAGVSHFIEHLLFKGSEKYTAQEIAEIFDGLGGE